MILAVYTAIHVLISLMAIASGFAVIFGFVSGRHFEKLTAFFLATTTATSVTGFFFPFHGFTPAYAFGVISLLVLGLAYYALYSRHLADGWRKVHVISAVVAQYLNFFVLIVQLFQKVPSLKALAPTQSEPPFAIVQGLAFVLFIGLGFAATLRCRAVASPGRLAS